MSAQTSFSYDITRSRHRGNKQSVAANPSDQHKKIQREHLYQLIEAATTWGKTSEELDDLTGNRGKNFFSGRLTELAKRQQIVKNGVRNGCAVWIATKFQGVKQ
jgi:hypothetical protein